MALTSGQFAVAQKHHFSVVIEIDTNIFGPSSTDGSTAELLHLSMHA